MRLVCAKSPEAVENRALVLVWCSLDRDSAGRQTSANAERATDFTSKGSTRDGVLSILKCDGYSIRMSWQTLCCAGVKGEVVSRRSSVFSLKRE